MNCTPVDEEGKQMSFYRALYYIGHRKAKVSLGWMPNVLFLHYGSVERFVDTCSFNISPTIKNLNRKFFPPFLQQQHICFWEGFEIDVAAFLWGLDCTGEIWNCWMIGAGSQTPLQLITKEFWWGSITPKNTVPLLHHLVMLVMLTLDKEHPKVLATLFYADCTLWVHLKIVTTWQTKYCISICIS